MPHDLLRSGVSLVLASGSPRRRELLGRLIPYFQVLTSPVEETGHEVLGEEPQLEPLSLPSPFHVPTESDPRLWAWRKAADVIHSNGDAFSSEIIVLGADTTVVGPSRVLGKPKDEQEAIEMLLLLRGIEHYVVTGFALLKPPTKSETALQTLHIEAITSRVVMKDCSLSEIERYVATGEPMDKAGAYALQGLGGDLVESVGGCRTNVIGLPLCAVRKAHEAAGVEVLAYPQRGYCEYCPSSFQV